ncbi:hypothetical protein RHGRI_019344 [Rhododendron griersonianum]|uniref:Mannosyltransferase n=1 Tax=Rhododendron griersonianum TaxID=479676 RepID=A0AAV6JJM3_9ERIC|nr:hypothetical protein RHGRI_019344 [Rhododendron griersonianum]
MFHLSLSESQNGSGSSLIGFRRSLCLIEELESVIGYDLLLGSIAAFYVFMVPYTKVEESFNVQAMHDVLYHRHHLEDVSSVVWFFDCYPLLSVALYLKFELIFRQEVEHRLCAILVSILASPVVSVMSLLHLPKIYSLFAVRLVLGCIILWTIRYFRIQIRKKFGEQVEAFFVILTGIQFHVLFYCTRPLPNIMALGLVNLAYGNWLKGHFYAALNCLIFATLIFRCDILLLLCPLGLELLLTKSITLWKALKCCIGTALFCIGWWNSLTVLVDTIMWKKFVWPEFQVLWFNSVLNRSSEWGVSFVTRDTSLPLVFHFSTSPFVACSISSFVGESRTLGVILDRRVVFYILPVVSYVLLYSKLPHKELRFVISSVPMFNLSAAIAASRMYALQQQEKEFLEIASYHFAGIAHGQVGEFLCFKWNSCIDYNLHMRYSKASKESRLQSEKLVYPHVGSLTNNSTERWVHIDPFSAMNGISRFCEDKFPWRYCKEEGIPIQEFNQTNFTYLLNEHSNIHGFKCLFAVSGFSRVRLQIGIPPISLLKEPKVFIHGNIRSKDVMNRNWPGCS